IEGNATQSLALQERGLGNQAFQTVVWLGNSKPSGTGEEGRQDAQEPVGKHPDVLQKSTHQWSHRGTQQQNPRTHQESLRIPQQTEVHHGHLLPLWRSQPLSRPMKNPPEIPEEAKNESLRQRVEEDLVTIYNNPELVRSFFCAESVVYAKD